MKKEVAILIAEDDAGHSTLIERNLSRAGITNQFLHFKDGQEILDFLLGSTNGAKRKDDTPYVLLLDINMPKVDGVDVLRRIRENGELKKLPVIMLTTTDDPKEVERCYRLGCNNYITKPVEYEKFTEAIRQTGLFLSVVSIPLIHHKALESAS